MKELSAGKTMHFPEILQCAAGAILPITKEGLAYPAKTEGDKSNFTADTNATVHRSWDFLKRLVHRAMYAEFAAADQKIVASGLTYIEQNR
jgi:hypothetical protein